MRGLLGPGERAGGGAFCVRRVRGGCLAKRRRAPDLQYPHKLEKLGVLKIGLSYEIEISSGCADDVARREGVGDEKGEGVEFAGVHLTVPVREGV